MEKIQLLRHLNRVEALGKSSKLFQFLSSPFRYLAVALSGNKKETIKEATLFYGKKMKVLLPASADIYLTQGKAENEAIRISRFLILELHKGDIFVDIGAYYGYYSLLATELVGNKGHVYAIEATPKTFNILAQNAQANDNIIALNYTVSDRNDKVAFYEFNQQYSSHNTLDIHLLENEEWYKNNIPTKILVDALPIDEIVQEHNFIPTLIKIDVEGAENLVIRGAQVLLSQYHPMILMKYILNIESTNIYAEAARILLHLGYAPFAILNNGEIERIDDIVAYLQSKKLDTDTFVFRHEQ